MPQITEVMCKLPFGAHGSAAGKALQLLKQCAAQVCPRPSSVELTAPLHAFPLRVLTARPSLAPQVTPDRPDDLRIIVDDLRAFISSNNPASVAEMFSQAIETLLIDYVKALGPQHSVVRRHTPRRLTPRRHTPRHYTPRRHTPRRHTPHTRDRLGSTVYLHVA